MAYRMFEGYIMNLLDIRSTMKLNIDVTLQTQHVFHQLDTSPS